MRTLDGVHQESWDALNKGVDRAGYTKTASYPTKYGKIYVCEKFVDDKYLVMWEARDLICTNECVRWSTLSERNKSAKEHALAELKKRETVYKEF